MKRITSLLLLLGATLSSYAQQVLTLDSCRALALANNKELRISQEKVNAAHYEKKAAFTNYLPKIDLTGGYMRTQKEISLLSDAQKQSIGNMGTNLGNQLQQGMQSAEFQAAMKQLAAANPGLAAGLPGLLPGGRTYGWTECRRTRSGGCLPYRYPKHDDGSCDPHPASLYGWKNHCLQQDYQICRTSG